jgi:hypothetical protein
MSIGTFLSKLDKGLMATEGNFFQFPEINYVKFIVPCHFPIHKRKIDNNFWPGH